MTIEEQIKEAQRTAELSVAIAREAGAELLGVEAVLAGPPIGVNAGLARDRLIDRRERCKDRQLRHEESAAVWSATARKLRERYPVESLSAEGQKSLKRRQFDDEEQAQTIDQERNEALGLAPDQAPPERSMGRPSPELAS